MKYYLILVLLLSACFSSSAQQLRVDSKIIKNEEGNEIEAWVAHVDQDPGYSMESYDDFMKKVFDMKASKSNKSTMSAIKVTFREISVLRLDQRTTFTPESGGTAIAFTFSPGYDIHFGGSTNYADEFAKCEGLVKSFVRFHYKNFYTKKIKSLQEDINDRQKEIEASDKQVEKNNKSILDNTNKISKGDSDAAKLKLKNESMESENLTLKGTVTKDRAEISTLQDQLASMNESLRKVEAF
jgi:hypothetical protein